MSGLASTPWRDLPQTLRTRLRKPPTPQRHCLHIDLQCLRKIQIRDSRGRCQNNPASQRHLLRRPMRRRPLLQLLAVSILQI